MSDAVIADMTNFKLGTPSLVCRWRLSGGHLPLQNRHLRALRARSVNSEQVTRQLMSWAKQHIEWTLETGSAENPDGVLMLIIDREGQAAMSVGPYAPLKYRSAATLARRALNADVEAELTGVAPETLVGVRNEMLVIDPGSTTAPAGILSLVIDLAHTLGIPITHEPGMTEHISHRRAHFDELFLASDEHGIVCSTTYTGPLSKRFAQGYTKLLEQTRSRSAPT